MLLELYSIHYKVYRKECSKFIYFTTKNLALVILTLKFPHTPHGNCINIVPQNIPHEQEKNVMELYCHRTEPKATSINSNNFNPQTTK